MIKRYLPLIANIAAAIIFGFAMLFIKTGMQLVEQDTIKFLAFRFTTGFIVLSLLLLTGLRKVDYRGKPVHLLFLCGALNPLVSQTLETTATTYAPTSQIAVFSSLVPVLVVLLSVPVNRELPSRRQVVCMLLSVGGIMMIHLVGGQMEGATTRGLVLILCFAAVLSVQRVLIRRASGRFSAFETIYVSTGMGAAGFTLTTIIRHAAAGRLSGFFDGLLTPGFVVSILYMGIMSCVVAFLCLTYAVGHLPIAVSSATSMLGTVITVLVGVFILGEKFRPIDAVGAVIAMAGILGISLSYNAAKPHEYTGGEAPKEEVLEGGPQPG